MARKFCRNESWLAIGADSGLCGLSENGQSQNGRGGDDGYFHRCAFCRSFVWWADKREPNSRALNCALSFTTLRLPENFQSIVVYILWSGFRRRRAFNKSKKAPAVAVGCERGGTSNSL